MKSRGFAVLVWIIFVFYVFCTIFHNFYFSQYFWTLSRIFSSNDYYSKKGKTNEALEIRINIIENLRKVYVNASLNSLNIGYLKVPYYIIVLISIYVYVFYWGSNVWNFWTQSLKCLKRSLYILESLYLEYRLNSMFKMIYYMVLQTSNFNIENKESIFPANSWIYLFFIDTI